MSRRAERVAAQIARDVGEILQRKVRDPDVGMVTITRVDVGDDLRQARLYFAVYGDAPAAERAARALSRAARFIRRELTPLLGLRLAPEIEFVFDRPYSDGMAVLDMIRDLGLDSPKPPNHEPDADAGPQ